MTANTPTDFMRVVRTRAFNIIGFGELLALDGLELPPGRRQEYVRIMREETRALERDVDAYFGGSRVAATCVGQGALV